MLHNDDVVMTGSFVLSADITSLVISFVALPILAVFFLQRLRSALAKSFTVTHGTYLVVGGLPRQKGSNRADSCAKGLLYKLSALLHDGLDVPHRLSPIKRHVRRNDDPL